MSDSDDEYGPLQATWGAQTPTVASEGAGWDSLKDPNAKLTEKGLGTGQLHRKGRNFKPVDEQIILSQRLQKNSSKKKGSSRSFSQDNASTTSKTQNHRKSSLPSSSTPQQHQKAKSKKPSFSTPTSPPMRPSSSLAGRMSRPAQSNNAWSKPLVDTPFWESDLPNIPSPQSPSSSSSPPFQSSSIESTLNNNDTQNHNHNSNNNHYHHHHHHHHHHENSNNGWGALAPRKPINQSSGTAEQWNPPQIASNGGWGNVDATSKGDWSNNDDDWGSTPRNNAQVSMDEPSASAGGDSGWGAAHNNANSNGGWGNKDNNKGWATPASSNTGNSDNSRGWGTPTSPNNDNNGGWNSANKATPSWIDSVEGTNSMEGGKSGGRFSNRSRKKYSDIPIEVPKPRNYDTNAPVSFPTAVAPPPPPDNDHLITINVELSDTIKVPVPIRELDEPVQLAQKFAAEQNLQSPQVLQAIINLFTSQKDAALLKKRQKLVKKYPSRPHPTNYYTEAFDYPEYLPTVYNNAPSLTTPFTRRAYY